MYVCIEYVSGVCVWNVYGMCGICKWGYVFVGYVCDVYGVCKWGMYMEYVCVGHVWGMCM